MSMRNGRFRTALWLLPLILLAFPLASQAQSSTVTFDSQGGTEASPTNKIVTLGELYGPLAFTTNTGYTFAGWWTATGGLGRVVYPGTVVVITTNQTLYAKWTANSYTVTFSGEGGSVPTPPNKSVAFGSPYGPLATTVLPGYTFAGWWTEPAGAGTMISTGTVVAITADQTLYANWTSKTYVVTFDAQGGTESSPTNKIVAYDALYGPLAWTTNTGYTFAGWWTEPGGSGTVVSAGTVVKILADQTLYAKWTANSYTVSFDGQGGSVPTPPNKSVAFGSPYGTLATTTLPGYTFTGWWTAPGGSGTMVSAATVVSLTADQTLYASWTSKTYTVTFDAQGGEEASPAGTNVTYDAPYGPLATTTRPGYTFAGWYTDAGGAGSLVSAGTIVKITANQTLYAKWTAKSYTVTFNGQGGTVPVPAAKTVTNDLPYGTLATTTLPGYTFAGWWTEPGGTGTIVTAGTVVVMADDHTLYAKWNPNSYSVTFDAQGGEASIPAATNVTYDALYGPLATTTRAGFTFAGWWTAPGGAGTLVTAGTVVKITANQTLYANWTSASYVVTFDAQGGGTPSPASKSVTFGLSYGTLATTTRAGYTFAGWWTEAGGAGAAVSNATTVTEPGAHTLYAKWNPNSYSVTFDAQGGAVPSPAGTNVTYDAPYGTLATTTRSGYAFGGWWTEAGGVGTMVSASTVVKITADQTLYAKWTPASYTVTFSGQGGSAPSPASKSVTFDSTYGPLATTARAGYSFAGWWTAPGGAGTMVSASTVVAVTADQTLYANWTLNTYVVTFDAQGGSVPTPASTNVTYDAPYGPLAATTRSGYTFAGWWTGAGGTGTMVSDGVVVKITADQTLYAKWMADSYTVTFNGQGGSVPAPANKSVSFDSPYGTLATTTLPGYTFAGWWTETNGAGTMVSAATVVARTNDHILYASWTSKSYVLTFDAQGGVVPTPASTNVTYDAPYGPLAATTRSGYSFAGWWTAPGGAGTLVSAGMVVKITADQTLYAKWTPSSYTVSFDGQGGSVPAPVNKSVAFDSPYGALATTALPGYLFAGWWTETNGAGTMVSASTVVAITADQTLYAKWTPNSYMVTFDEQGGSASVPANKSVSNDAPYGALATTTRSGYAFGGWWTEAGGAGTLVSASTVVKITANQTLYAKWTPASYTVTFSGQGGSAPSPASKSVTFDSTYGPLATTARAGYTFAGWWTAPGGAGTMVSASTVVAVTADQTLYANWTLNTYVVTFDAQGGSVPTPASTNVTYDAPYGPLATTTRSGYSFAGWWTGVGGTGTMVSDGMVVKITADQTLYAKWTADSYTVTFNGQGGSVPAPVNKSVTFDSPYGALATTALPGYTFAGWWTETNGAGTMVSAATLVTRTNDHTLYASWTSKSYVLTFDAQGGSVPSPASTNVTYDAPYGSLAATMRSGFTFAGWWTAPGGAGTQVSAGMVVKITADQTLYAKWTADSYTVTFNGQGGSVPAPVNKSVTFDSPYGALATTTLPGYTFAGWWTETNGAGTMVSAATLVTRTNDHTLYASWTSKSYVLTFDAQGGSVPAPASTNVTYDAPYGPLATTTLSGYTFAGWWTAPDGAGTRISAGTVVKITANQTLYAKWTASSYTVTFNGQGGSVPAPVNKSVTFDSPYGALATTALPGYTFAGWWTETNGAGTMVSAGTVVSITADQTLYASWTPNSYMVSFDEQGGMASIPASKSVANDAPYGTLATTTRSGYTFGGWWTEVGGAGTMVSASTVVKLTANQTLFAKWTPNSYTVTFSGQGGSAPSPASKSVTFDSTYGPLATTARAGYSFAGWWTAPGGAGTMVSASTVVAVTADQTLYANWTLNTYVVTFDAQGGSVPTPASTNVTYDAPYGPLAATTRSGYTFAGWWTGAGGTGTMVSDGVVVKITADQTLYAKWTADSYTVTFNGQGGSVPAPANKSVSFDSPYGTLATTTLPGYTFAGWWTETNGAGTMVSAATVVARTNDHILYASWTSKSYVLTFDAQGGDEASPASTTVSYDAPYGPLAATVRAGFTFAGWWTAPGGAGTLVSAGMVVKITADQTLYAKWTADSYTVTFNGQGGSVPAPANKSVTFDSPYGALATTVLPGYTFAGWWTEAGGTGTMVSAVTMVTRTNDHTLYANWTSKSYVVTFDAQGGEESSPASTTVSYDATYGPLATTTRAGYTFEGWWTAPGGAGTQVSAGLVVKITADQTLYAKWTADSYTVTFSGQGGSVPTPPNKSVTFDSPYGALATTTRPGYTFAGWWTEAGGTGTMVSAVTLVTRTNDHTLYANWTSKSYVVTFDAQGGEESSPASTTVSYDATYGPLATTTRAGYTFEGWWTAPGGAGTQVSAGLVVKITADQTLYAKWTADSYTVTFSGQGGSVPTPPNKSITFDSPYGVLATTTLPGYTFAGWWTEAGGTGTMVTAVTMVTRTNDHTLYANWTSKSYVVTFDAQGGDESIPASTTVSYDATYGPLATTTRAGYTFAGWWTAPGGAGTQVSAGLVVKITADQTLYAKWAANIYTVTFDAQDGNIPNPANKSVTFDSPYGVLATTVMPGYTFAGWWTEPGGTGTMVTAVTLVTRTNDHTLYANWTSKSYMVTFDAMGGDAPDFTSKSVTNDLPYGKLATTTRSGYVFSGWWTEEDGAGTLISASMVVKITADQALYAFWTPANYTVTFDAQGGSGPSPAGKSVAFDSPYGTLATTARSGYTFEGWWTETNGAGAEVTAGTMVTVTNHHTLYANWTPNDYTVTFDSQNGSAPSPAVLGVTFDQPYGPLATTSRLGFNFLGWWTGVGGTGTEITSGMVCKITADLTLYAKWASAGQIRFVMLNFMATEGFPQKVFVERVNGSNGVASVNYKTKQKTALDWLDFIPKNGTLTWTNGEAGTKMIKIPIIADGLTEGYEMFRVLLKKPVGATLALESEAMVIIPEHTAKAGDAVKDATAIRMAKLSRALDDASLTWFTSEQAPWTRQTLVTADGVDAGMSGERASGHVSWLQTDVEGAGTLEFDWLATGTGMDACLVLVNGAVRCKRVAGSDWAHETLELGEGDHTVRWVFVKGGVLTEGAVFLDRVKWAPEQD